MRREAEEEGSKGKVGKGDGTPEVEKSEK